MKVLIFTISLLIALACSPARGDVEFLHQKPSMYLGLEYTHTPLPCRDKNENTVAIAGVTVPLAKSNHMELLGSWTHISCAFNWDDDYVYDGMGIRLEWQFK